MGACVGTDRESELCVHADVSDPCGKTYNGKPYETYTWGTCILIETKQLEYFVVCARLSSFSRAAEALYTTQPNVSKVIRMLEQELGFSLFIRQSRGIVLTARGRRVFPSK